MTDHSNTPKSNGRRRGTRASLAGLAALTMAAAALAPAASADRQDGNGDGDLAHVASYLRQDRDTIVNQRKFRVGCILVKYTHPPDPTECTITATYKGEVIDTYTRSIDQPIRGWETDLHMSDRQALRLDRSNKRISYIKLKLRAVDGEGNVGTDVERISVIDGLYD